MVGAWRRAGGREPSRTCRRASCRRARGERRSTLNGRSSSTRWELGARGAAQPKRLHSRRLSRKQSRFGDTRIDVRVRLEQANMAMEQGRLPRTSSLVGRPMRSPRWRPKATTVALDAPGPRSASHKGSAARWKRWVGRRRGPRITTGSAATRRTVRSDSRLRRCSTGRFPSMRRHVKRHRLLDETVDRRSEARVGTRLGALAPRPAGSTRLGASPHTGRPCTRNSGLLVRSRSRSHRSAWRSSVLPAI